MKLREIVLYSFIGLASSGLIGCGSSNSFKTPDFKAETCLLGQENLSRYKKGDFFVLEVVKPDSSMVRYYSSNDFDISLLEITIGKITNSYPSTSPDLVVQDTLIKAGEQYRNYKKRFHESLTAPMYK